MAYVSEAEKAGFFKAVEEASKKAIWCAVASVDAQGAPRVRIVHPTWEGDVLWFASEPRVDVQFLVSPPDFTHILCRGRAVLVTDPGEKKRVWDVIDYDLSQFWPGGPDDANYLPVKVLPERVELSRMFGTVDKKVWRRR
jgi:general stress protein 26